MTDRADWITGRFKCDVDHCMKEIRKAVIADIADMNRLHPTPVGAPDRFVISEQVPWMVVENQAHGRAFAHRHFEAQSTYIQIKDPYHNKVIFSVRPKWCRSRHECIYSFKAESDQKEEELLPWQISERVLYPIFFSGYQQSNS